ERHELMLREGDLPDAGAALLVNQADLTARQLDRAVLALFRRETASDAGGANELPALALAQLDVVHERARGDVRQRQAVAGPDIREAAGQHLVAHLQAVGREDVGLLAVS